MRVTGIGIINDTEIPAAEQSRTNGAALVSKRAFDHSSIRKCVRGFRVCDETTRRQQGSNRPLADARGSVRLSSIVPA
jgi:hypothetical protein